MSVSGDNFGDGSAEIRVTGLGFRWCFENYIRRGSQNRFCCSSCFFSSSITLTFHCYSLIIPCTTTLKCLTYTPNHNNYNNYNTPTTTTMKVLIIGAGIAGLALALNLSNNGHSVIVIERHNALRTSGLQIDLRGQGIQVLKLMGLDAAFREHSVPERGMQVVDAAGKRWGYFPVNNSGKGKQSFTSEYEIMRVDFCKIMYGACGSGVEFRFGTTLKTLEERDGGVHVSFGDGKEEVFDLVVGADGQWSQTRRMVFGDGGMEMIRDTCVAYFKIDMEGDDFLATMFMAGKGGVMTRRQNEKQLQVYIGCSSDKVSELKRGDVEAEKDLLAEVFDGAGWKSEEIVSGMRTAEDFYFERPGLVKLDKWSKGRVVLLGDAAYCPTLMTGMGTTSALVGAYILAGEIQKSCEGQVVTDADVAKALNGYESKLRPFMDAITKRVNTDGGMGFPDSRLGMMLVLWGMRIATALRLSSLMDVFAIKEIKWELPRY